MKIVSAILDQMEKSAPYATSKPLRLADVELSGPGPEEILVKIEAAGLCHSDLSVINGDRPRPTPMALGHEACATVMETGSNVADLSPGDRVVLSFLPTCGHCPSCYSGESYLCDNGAAANGAGVLLSGESRLQEGTTCVHHHLGVSAFASHAVVDHRSAVRIPSDIPVEIAALFGCAVLTGVGAVLNTAKLIAGESVLIYGMGGVGLSALLGARAGGGTPIAVIDPSPAKRELALELGADAALAPDAGPDAVEKAIGRKPDLVIETVGRAAVLETAYKAARRGGRIVTVGLPNPTEHLSIPAVSLVAEGKTLMGSYMGSSVAQRDIPRFIQMWRSGRLPVERLLTSVSPLSEINSLFDALDSGQAIRQIVIP